MSSGGAPESGWTNTRHNDGWKRRERKMEKVPVDDDPIRKIRKVWSWAAAVAMVLRKKNGRIKSRGETQTTHSTEASVGEKDWKRRADWATTQKCTAKKKEKKRSRKRKHKLFSYTIHILCFYLFCGFACAQRRRHAESLLFVTERFSLHLWCGQRSLSSS